MLRLNEIQEQFKLKHVKCADHECGAALQCFRYVSLPEQFQEWFKSSPRYDWGLCMKFIPLTEELNDQELDPLNLVEEDDEWVHC